MVCGLPYVGRRDKITAEKNGSYFIEKVEECHLENGCMQAWELALFGR